MEKTRVKCFVTGDNHFGKKFGRYKDYKEVENKLKQSRFDSFENMIKKAEQERCSFFIITGDLFDKTHSIPKKDIKKVVEILSTFSGDVLILPGNHDYYDEDSEIWQDFLRYSKEYQNNITLLNKFELYTFKSDDGEVVFYPAYCHSEHSKTNNLEWIKNKAAEMDHGAINIGIAHGAIEGITPDLNGEYFLMTEKELNDIPVDAWFIGHTHIPYPNSLKEDEDKEGIAIFNAGTHEQTDLNNNSEGNGFIVAIEKQNNIAKVLSKKFISGLIRFYDIDIALRPSSETVLYDTVKAKVEKLSPDSVIRLKLSGTIKTNEYKNREQICNELCRDFIFYEIEDFDLHEEIDKNRIRSEFAETSFTAKLLESFLDEPAILQDAYKLIRNSKEQ